MPPFRNGFIEVDLKFDGDALKALRDIGHGHRINIVDASYDIPRGAEIVKYPGTSAEAFLGVVKLIPIEGEDSAHPDVTVMSPDATLAIEIEDKPNHVAARAGEAFFAAGEDLVQMQVGSHVNIGDSFASTDWTDTSSRVREDIAGLDGFYTIASNPREQHLFIKTIDELPFACVSLVAGHSQRTE